MVEDGRAVGSDDRRAHARRVLVGCLRVDGADQAVVGAEHKEGSAVVQLRLVAARHAAHRGLEPHGLVAVLVLGIAEGDELVEVLDGDVCAERRRHGARDGLSVPAIARGARGAQRELRAGQGRPVERRFLLDRDGRGLVGHAEVRGGYRDFLARIGDLHAMGLVVERPALGHGDLLDLVGAEVELLGRRLAVLACDQGVDDVPRLGAHRALGGGDVGGGAHLVRRAGDRRAVGSVGLGDLYHAFLRHVGRGHDKRAVHASVGIDSEGDRGSVEHVPFRRGLLDQGVAAAGELHGQAHRPVRPGLPGVLGLAAQLEAGIRHGPAFGVEDLERGREGDRLAGLGVALLDLEPRLRGLVGHGDGRRVLAVRGDHGGPIVLGGDLDAVLAHVAVGHILRDLLLDPVGAVRQGARPAVGHRPAVGLLVAGRGVAVLVGHDGAHQAARLDLAAVLGGDHRSVGGVVHLEARALDGDVAVEAGVLGGLGLELGYLGQAVVAALHALGVLERVVVAHGGVELVVADVVQVQL